MNRTVKLPPEAMQALAEQREAFIRKFGREPRGDDPVFFDPDSDTPKPMDERKMAEQMRVAMIEAGLPPQFVYAWEKTGLLVNDDGYRNLSARDRAEYDAAVDEYFRLEKANGTKH